MKFVPIVIIIKSSIKNDFDLITNIISKMNYFHVKLITLTILTILFITLITVGSYYDINASYYKCDYNFSYNSAESSTGNMMLYISIPIFIIMLFLFFYNNNKTKPIIDENITITIK